MAKKFSLKEYDELLKRRTDERMAKKTQGVIYGKEDQPVFTSNDVASGLDSNPPAPVESLADATAKKALAPLQPQSVALKRMETMAGKITGKGEGLDYAVGAMGSSQETGERFTGGGDNGFRVGTGEKMNNFALKKLQNLKKGATDFLKGAEVGAGVYQTPKLPSSPAELGMFYGRGAKGLVKYTGQALGAGAEAVKALGAGAVDVGGRTFEYLGTTNPVTRGSGQSNAQSAFAADLREAQLREVLQARQQGRPPVQLGEPESVGNFARRITGENRGIWSNGIGNNLWRNYNPAQNKTLVRELVERPDIAERQQLAMELGSLTNRLARARIAAATFQDKAQNAIKPKDQKKFYEQALEANAAANGLSLAIRELSPQPEPTLRTELVAQSRNRSLRVPGSNAFGKVSFRGNVPRAPSTPQMNVVAVQAVPVQTVQRQQNVNYYEASQPTPRLNKSIGLKGFNKLNDRSAFGNPNQESLGAQAVGVSVNPNRKLLFGKFGFR